MESWVDSRKRWFGARSIAGTVLIVATLFALHVLAAEPPPGSKVWAWPANQGVVMRYGLDLKPFGGMDEADYYFNNNNGFDVRVTWVMQIVYEDGFSETLGEKGPVTIRAGGSLRTGWGGDSDLITVKDHGLPKTVNCLKFSAVNPAQELQQQAAKQAQQLALQQQQAFQQQQEVLQQQQQALQQQIAAKRQQLQQQFEEKRQQLAASQKSLLAQRQQAAVNAHVSRAESYQAAGQTISSGIQAMGNIIINQMQRDAAERQAQREEEQAQRKQERAEAEFREQEEEQKKQQQELEESFRQQMAQLEQNQSAPAAVPTFTPVFNSQTSVSPAAPLAPEPARPLFYLMTLISPAAPKPAPSKGSIPAVDQLADFLLAPASVSSATPLKPPAAATLDDLNAAIFEEAKPRPATARVQSPTNLYDSILR